ncbi:tripartite tricarboxylate transporter substrate-binding protein [Aquabacterium sp. A7-Y]|uniref:Bug family tripartite tricarboxylate transporter substrate binding protein n=1 Tax=Aquabacterium sp. A7-Y TaxID=1349605 RepID=UPI00223D6C6B|nr:tripartite tricarboxylate transporter substrate-binding protein [Aquabacterium sp. A7-Y]MCW7538749.1 tripartite tricarboxylate transporter substrate-binding protein [Aquabacterium sp. A7-Y]
MPTRRHTLVAAAGLALPAIAPLVPAQSGRSSAAATSGAPAALPRLKIYIPANAGGGWDQTGRSLGGALQAAQLVQHVEYENKGGKGGTLGLADFVARHGSDPDALLIGGMVMIGALAVNRDEQALRQVTPIARLTSDYMVLVAPAGGRITDLKKMVAEVRQNLATVPIAGGSAGGVDHMLAGMIVRSLGVNPAGLQYRPTSSGKDAVVLLQSGQAAVAISGYSEFKAGIEDKSLVPLAVSSRKTLFGIPSLREQGIDTELANWRGVFAPGLLEDSRKVALRQLVIRATESPAWRQALLDNNWLGSLLYGKEFEDFLAIEQGIASAVTLMLKLKA